MSAPMGGPAPLARVVDDAHPRRQVARSTRRLAITTFGITSLGLLGLARLAAGPAPIAVASIQRAPIGVPIAVPIAVPIVVPPAPPRLLTIPILLAPGDDLACPTPPVADRPIGLPVPASALTTAELDPLVPVAEVAASAVAPVIAVRVGDEVWVSDDDGARFRRALATDPPIRAIAVDDDGRVYAATPASLGVREPGGRERWTARPPAAVAADTTPPPDGGALIAIGHGAVWITTDLGLVSRAGGPWRPLPAEITYPGALTGGASWDGVIYRSEHIQDMCGLDDYETTSSALGRDLRSLTFHLEGGGPRLRVVDDRGASWRYEIRCTGQTDGFDTDDRDDHAACGPRRDLRRDRSLLVAALQPTIGARVLFVDQGALVELCGLRAHPLAHAFGAEPIAAVDAGGRPLVVREGALWRWSPRYGWRVLFEGAPAPAPPDGGGPDI
jgi:hypothetical protein